MNQKEWVEYFEAVNGRKPSMQEFQAGVKRASLSLINPTHLLQ